MTGAADLAVMALWALHTPPSRDPDAHEAGERVWYATCPLCSWTLLIFEEPEGAARFGCLKGCATVAVTDRLDRALAGHFNQLEAAA